MGATENVERLLKIAVVGKRPAIARQQRLVAGVGDGGLLKHGGGLATLPGGTQRLAIGQGGFGILGIGAVALALDFDGAMGVGIRARSAFGDSDPVISGMV